MHAATDSCFIAGEETHVACCSDFCLCIVCMCLIAMHEDFSMHVSVTSMHYTIKQRNRVIYVRQDCDIICGIVVVVMMVMIIAKIQFNPAKLASVLI